MLSPRELVDLLILGFSWLEREKPKTRLRASMVFYALYYCKQITEKERRAIALNTQVLELLYPLMHIEFIEGKLNNKKLRELALTSDKQLIMLVQPAGRVVNKKILGAQGYYFLLTEKGREKANELELPYEKRATPRQFIQAWEQARLQLGRRVAGMDKADREAASGRGDGALYIPPNSVSEKEWMW